MKLPTSNVSYRRYVLTVLTGVYTLSLLDQGLITLVLQPIKQDLHASDTQLGFATGLAFGLLYSTVALPVARWSDRGNRATITSIALALWGSTVALALWVTSFTQLVLARMAASLGGAGCMPPSYSLVGDYFTAPVERARAMSVYMLAAPLSYLVSFGLGGWLSEHFGWRASFCVIGVPGLLLAALVKFTVADPRQHPTAPERTSSSVRIVRTLWRRPSTRHLLYALLIVYILGLGTLPWYGAFMMRSHGMRTAELGLWFGAIFGACGVIGALFGGYAATRWFAQDERGQMRMVAVTIAALLPCLAGFLLLENKYQSLGALTLLMVIWNMYLGPTFALLQRLVTDDMRATTLAVVMLICNLIGMGVGPQMVGALSDLLSAVAGNNALRYAMLIVSMATLWAAYHFWQVGRTVKADLLSVPHATREDRPGAAFRDKAACQ